MQYEAFVKSVLGSEIPTIAKLTTPGYPPLEQVNRPCLETNEAAHYLNRQPQTLRVWAMRQSGPIEPIRVHGRLAWRTSDVKRLMGVQQ